VKEIGVGVCDKKTVSLIRREVFCTIVFIVKAKTILRHHRVARITLSSEIIINL
jgi:hypothetical protein